MWNFYTVCESDEKFASCNTSRLTAENEKTHGAVTVSAANTRLNEHDSQKAKQITRKIILAIGLDDQLFTEVEVPSTDFDFVLVLLNIIWLDNVLKLIKLIAEFSLLRALMVYSQLKIG